MRKIFSDICLDDIFFLTGFYMMLIVHHIPVISRSIYLLGAFICFLYIIFGSKNRIDKAYIMWTICYVAFFICSILWSIKWKTSVFVFAIHLLPIFSLTFATMIYLSNYQRFKKILIAQFVCSIVLLCYLATNIDEFVLGIRLGANIDNPNEDDKIWNANVIGMSFCFALYSGWIVFMNSRSKINKIFYIFVSVLMIIAVLLTGSRKTLLMLLIPISYFFYRKSKKYFLISIMGLVAFLGISFFLVMNVEMFYSTIGVRVDEMITILSGEATGREDDSRYYLIQYGLQWWPDNPILGIGINCFRVLSNVTNMFAGRNFYAHNNYIELLVDVGIIGTFLYYSGHYYLIKESIKIKSNLTVWIALFVVVALILDMAYVSYYDLNNQLLLVIMFGLLRMEKKQILLKKIKRKYENC